MPGLLRQLRIMTAALGIIGAMGGTGALKRTSGGGGESTSSDAMAGEGISSAWRNCQLRPQFSSVFGNTNDQTAELMTMAIERCSQHSQATRSPGQKKREIGLELG